MFLRKPSKIPLKMEDDMLEYDYAKKNEDKNKVQPAIKFTSSAFLTPNSIKFQERSDMIEEEWD